MPDQEEVRVICLPTAAGNPGGFDDNIYGKCAECGQGIHWRPSAPVGAKICMPCYLKLALPDDEIRVTKKVAEEFMAWWVSTLKKTPDPLMRRMVCHCDCGRFMRWLRRQETYEYSYYWCAKCRKKLVHYEPRPRKR